MQPHVLVIVGGEVNLAAQEERVKLKLIANGGKPYRNGRKNNPIKAHHKQQAKN